MESVDKPLVVIVGAGLGGLAAAVAISLTFNYSVVVLEKSSRVGEIGAGIQVSPNASRLLSRWGCSPHLDGEVVEPTLSRIFRWKDGRVLSTREMNPKLLNDFGSPYWQVHRADLHSALLQRAEQLGVDVRMNSRITSAEVAEEACRLILHDRQSMECDFLVGADGIRSRVRETVCPGFSQPCRTGDLAYRFTIPTDQMLEEPVLHELAERSVVSSWWGPGSHIVAYPLRAGALYNVVVVFPDDGSVASDASARGTLAEMEEQFQQWCPQVRSLLRLADPSGLTKWTLLDLPSLPRWGHDRAVLLGDACHPMLPYLAQGSAQAIEDAAVLAKCLEHLPSRLDRVPEIYTKVRYARATQVQQFARAQRHRNHLFDGAEQVERDATMSSSSKSGAEPHSWKWASGDGQMPLSWAVGLFGYDAEREAISELRKDGIAIP